MALKKRKRGYREITDDVVEMMERPGRVRMSWMRDIEDRPHASRNPLFEEERLRAWKRSKLRGLGELKWKKTRGGMAAGGEFLTAGGGACSAVVVRSGKTTMWSVKKGNRFLDGGKAKGLKVAKQKVRRAMRYCTGPKKAR